MKTKVIVYIFVGDDSPCGKTFLANHLNEKTMVIDDICLWNSQTKLNLDFNFGEFTKIKTYDSIVIITRKDILEDIKDYIRNLEDEVYEYIFNVCKFEKESPFEKTMTPVDKLITKTLHYGLGSFVNSEFELIVIPEINAYFRLEDVKTEIDFYCKILHWLTFYYASNHWWDEWSLKMIKYIKYMLGTDFSIEEMDALYCVFGNGLNHDLCVKFIESGFDFNLIKKEHCDNCRGGCFAKEEK